MYVQFEPRVVPVQNFEVREQGEEIFRIALSKKDSYDALALKVAEYLSSVSTTGPIDPTHIRFSTVTANTGKPRAIVKRQQGTTVANILLGTGSYGSYGYASTQAPDHMYYEVLEMSLTDLEQRKNVRINWLSEGITIRLPGE